MTAGKTAADVTDLDGPSVSEAGRCAAPGHYSPVGKAANFFLIHLQSPLYLLGADAQVEEVSDYVGHAGDVVDSAGPVVPDGRHTPVSGRDTQSDDRHQAFRKSPHVSVARPEKPTMVAVDDFVINTCHDRRRPSILNQADL
jgi:hypothetical protein